MILFGSLLFLAGCGDPLKDFDRIGDVELAEDAAQALPTDAEVAREGFFGTDAAMGVDEPVAARAEPAAPSGGGFLGGLFGGGAASGSDAAEDVAFGTVLPFGQVGRVCEAKGKDLGALVEKAQARGHALYDYRPGSSAARSYYVTGFSDDCPRQFTAANALFGAPSMYEQLHYGPGGDALPVTSTDQAYEKVKSSFCRSGKGKPCGSRMSALEKTTVFISAYEHFEENARWADILIHDGAIVAASVKSN
jgi:hypothetical protein